MQGKALQGKFDASICINGPFKNVGSAQQGEVSLLDNQRNRWIDIRAEADIYKDLIRIVSSTVMYMPYGINGVFPYQLQLDRRSGDYHWIAEGAESRGECEKIAFSEPPAKQKREPIAPPPNKF